MPDRFREPAREIDLGDLGAALLADAGFRLLVALAVDRVGAGVGSCFDQRPAEIARALLAEWPTEIALFVRQKLGTLIAIARKDDLQVLQEFLELGTVKPVVDRTFALSEVAEAIRYLREGHARGKVVVTV